MSKCITVELTDGTKVQVNVDNNVTELPPEDIDALEDWIKSVRERQLKRKRTEVDR